MQNSPHETTKHARDANAEVWNNGEINTHYAIEMSRYLTPYSEIPPALVIRMRLK